MTPLALLVILEIPHPRGPVLRQNAAGFGPGPSRVELLAPLQRPKLLESHLAYGPIQEEVVDTAVVSVDGEACYTTGDRSKTKATEWEMVLVRGRHVEVLWPSPHTDTIKKNGYIVSDRAWVCVQGTLIYTSIESVAAGNLIHTYIVLGRA